MSTEICSFCHDPDCNEGPMMTPRDLWAAAFQREYALRRQLRTVAPEQRADLEAQIAEAANETRQALLKIRPAAEEGRGIQVVFNNRLRR